MYFIFLLAVCPSADTGIASTFCLAIAFRIQSICEVLGKIKRVLPHPPSLFFLVKT